jgi:hypothetical protein
LLCVSADTTKTPDGSIKAIITVAKSPDRARLKNDFFIMKTSFICFEIKMQINTIPQISLYHNEVNMSRVNHQMNKYSPVKRGNAISGKGDMKFRQYSGEQYKKGKMHWLHLPLGDEIIPLP